MADLRGREGRVHSWGPNSFNFMQFLGKFSKIVCWRPRAVGAPSLGKSWIRHCRATFLVYRHVLFSRGRGANPPEGTPTYDFAKISEKLHGIEKNWTLEAHPKFYYIDPPLHTIAQVQTRSTKDSSLLDICLRH